jgi:hypothetical protein
MYERKAPRVRLPDGTLGIPADALADIQHPDAHAAADGPPDTTDRPVD